MPVSIWLNDNEKTLQHKEWTGLISDVQNVFNRAFGFESERVELWNTSFFEESGGFLVSSVPVEELTKTNSFISLVEKGLREKFMLKITGKMEMPAEKKAFLNFFIRSDDRWGMPHAFFDTEIGEEDLLDILWSTDNRKEYASRLLDEISLLRVEVQGRMKRIADRVIVSRDFPDDDTLRENGTFMMYLSGSESRLINVLIRDYASKTSATGKISGLNVKSVSKMLYDDQFYKELWVKASPAVTSVPWGSLALISDTENGVPDLLNNLESKMVKPVVDLIPEDFLKNILNEAKSKIKIDMSGREK